MNKSDKPYAKILVWTDLIIDLGLVLGLITLMIYEPRTIPFCIGIYMLTNSTRKFFEERDKIKETDDASI